MSNIGSDGPGGFRTIDIDQALASGAITDREARELRRIDLDGSGTIDRAEANLDDGDTTDDKLDLDRVDLGRRSLFNNPEKRRQALAEAFFATQEGDLHASAAAVLERHVRDRSLGAGPAGLGQRVDSRSLAQVTTLCAVAAQEWNERDDDTRAAMARTVAAHLFDVEPVDVRQRQIWAAAFTKLPPELVGAIVRNNAEQLAAISTSPAGHGVARSNGTLSTVARMTNNLGAALRMVPPLRVGGPSGPSLVEVAVRSADEQIEAGRPDTAARIVNNSVQSNLPVDERAALYGRLTRAFAASDEYSLRPFDLLRRDMYATLAKDRDAFHARPRDEQALFAPEIFADMRATGAAVLKGQLEAHLVRVDAALAEASSAWRAAAAVIVDPGAGEAAKVAAITRFCQAARAAPEDELYEALLTPPPGAALDYPEPEWIGVLVHQARTATTAEDRELLLNTIENRFINFDGTFHAEGFEHLFVDPSLASLDAPYRLETRKILTHYAEHPEKLDPFALENVRQAILAEHGVAPQRGLSDDPLQTAIDREHRAWKAGEVAKDVGVVALQVGAVVGANAVAPVLGGAISAGLLTVDFVDTIHTIDLSHALNDAGAMTDDERRTEEVAAIVGLGLSIASTALDGRVTRGVTRMGMRLLRRGVPKGKVLRMAQRVARESGLSQRAARKYATELGETLGSIAVEERVRSAGNE